jgi:hypothetical protein
LEDLGVNGNIILNEAYVKVLTEFFLFRAGQGSGWLMKYGNEPSGFIKG